MNNLIPYAADITKWHQQAQQHAESAIECALKAGQLLVEAKTNAGHGEWLPFLESTGVNARTAQRYMRLASHAEQLKYDSVSHLSVTQALEYLSEPKDEPVEESRPEEVKTEEVIDQTLEPGEYLYKRYSETLEAWIWPYGNSKCNWILVDVVGDDAHLVSNEQPFELTEEHFTYPGVIRRTDDSDLEKAFSFRSEFTKDRPDAVSNLAPSVVMGRMRYRDKEWWPAWRLIGEGLDAGRKLYAPDCDILTIGNNKAFKQWRHDNGVGFMENNDVWAALYAVDQWEMLCELEMRFNKMEEAAA